MGQKIRPDSYRLGIINDWKERWFPKRNIGDQLEENQLIRRVINDKIASASVVRIIIERGADNIKVIIKAARPGLIIGRGGKGIEELSGEIKRHLEKLYRKRGSSGLPAINLNVEELKRTEVSAVAVAQNVAWDLERRMPYRRIIKKNLDLAMQNREVQGIKIRVSGRLNGADIARKEWLSKGKLPLQTLRADIDYGEATAYTTFGTIGVKVWVYKGEIFSDNSNQW